VEAAEANEVAIDVDTATLEKMLSIVERAWMALGESEPYWSVWTSDSFKKQNFDANAQTFYESGRRDTERLHAWLQRNGIEESGLKTCCEYGCGTGRVTPWLARAFPRVVACDISAAHLAIARRVLDERGIKNVQLTRVDSRSAIQSLEPFDILFSLIVFQHNPPPVIAFLLRTLLARLRPGGVLFFQVPTYATGYRFSAEEWLRLGDAHGMEMHVLPQRNVFAIALLAGCEVLEVQPDTYAGTQGWVSTTFLLRKRTV
jgi:SAM-dependent methyltransferase